MHIRAIALVGRRHRAVDPARPQRGDQRGDMDFRAADLVREIGERHMENVGPRNLAGTDFGSVRCSAAGIALTVRPMRYRAPPRRLAAAPAQRSSTTRPIAPPLLAAQIRHQFSTRCRRPIGSPDARNAASASRNDGSRARNSPCAAPL